MSTEPLRNRPMAALPIAAGTAAPATPRHETVIPDEEPEVLARLAEAGPDPTALRGVCAAHPTLLAAWARLGEVLLEAGDPVLAYAAARTGYHRGLDRLRRAGWGGSGRVRWAEPGNRGFLGALRLLCIAAADLGETDEAVRCREFLLELDPDDGVGAGAWPAVPGRGFRPTPPTPVGP